jgi:hypothetical protein
MNDLVTSWIRSVVPMIVGAALSWIALRTGIVIDEASQAGLVTAFTGLLSGLYYILVRWLETKFPQVGWLLGLPKQPGYVDASVPPPQPAPDELPYDPEHGASELNTVLLIVQVIFYIVGAIWFIDSLGWFS